MKTLQERLVFARAAAGLTQSQLAKLAGCSQSAIANVEAGTRNHLKNVFDVARALNCRAEWLQEGSGPMKEQPATSSGAMQAHDNVTPFSGYDWPFSFSKKRYVQLPENLKARADAYITGIIEAFEGGSSARAQKVP